MPRINDNWREPDESPRVVACPTCRGDVSITDCRPATGYCATIARRARALQAARQRACPVCGSTASTCYNGHCADQLAQRS